MTLQLCRFTLAFIWIYQGLVPKWLGPHPDEIAINLAAGATPAQAVFIARAGGTFEIALGMAILLCFRWRPLYALAALVVLVLHLVTAWVAPGFMATAFNAMTIDAAIVALCLIALAELSPPRATGRHAHAA